MKQTVRLSGSDDRNQLYEYSASELVQLVRDRSVSVREVVSDHLTRIDEVNGVINAVVSIDAENALREAGIADAALASGETAGALCGLPISFKDTVSTVGYPTTFGSVRYAGNIAQRDDLHVSRIRQAGAIRIGKTNVPEHAAGSNTFNALFGATRNPYDSRLSAGGSSGGAAAALAAGLQPIADGSDMGGSLRNPAAFCNVVGLRPTPGVVPNTSSNVAATLTVTGPMARTVEDVALLLSVMAGADDADPLSYGSPIINPFPPELALRGLRIAVAPTLGGRLQVDPEISERVEQAAKLLEEAGAQISYDAPDLTDSVSVFRTLRAAEFYAELAGDLDAGTEHFVDFVVENIDAGRHLSAADVIHAQEGQTRLVRTAAEFFTQYDFLLSPTTAILPFPVEDRYPKTVNGVATKDYLTWMESCFALTPLGVPGISIPYGFSASGLPIGLQITAGARQDNRLLSFARSLPTFSPSPSRSLSIGDSHHV